MDYLRKVGIGMGLAATLGLTGCLGSGEKESPSSRRSSERKQLDFGHSWEFEYAAGADKAMERLVYLVNSVCPEFKGVHSQDGFNLARAIDNGDRTLSMSEVDGATRTLDLETRGRSKITFEEVVNIVSYRPEE